MTVGDNDKMLCETVSLQLVKCTFKYKAKQCQVGLPCKLHNFPEKILPDKTRQSWLNLTKEDVFQPPSAHIVASWQWHRRATQEAVCHRHSALRSISRGEVVLDEMRLCMNLISDKVAAPASAAQRKYSSVVVWLRLFGKTRNNDIHMVVSVRPRSHISAHYDHRSLTVLIPHSKTTVALFCR